jgi:hypothetical protein
MRISLNLKKMKRLRFHLRFHFALFLSIILIWGSSKTILAQTNLGLDQKEINLINDQPILEVQGVEGVRRAQEEPTEAPDAVSTPKKGIIFGPQYYSPSQGEQEAQAIGAESAEPFNPRESLITIPF